MRSALRSPRGQPVWIFLGFFAGAALLFAPFVATGFLEGADDVLHYLPYRVFVGQALRSGELPLWNPLAGIGMPVAGNPQYGLYYPPNLLFACFSPLVAQALYVLLHLALAGMFTTLYLRRLGLTAPARLFGGVAYALCGPVLAYIGALPMLAVFPWLPAASLAFERFDATRRHRWLVWAAAALALAVLAGHPPGAINVWFAVALHRGALAARRGDRKALVELGLSFALAACLAAILVLPVIALRPELTLVDELRHQHDGSFRPDLLLEFLFPDVHCETYLGLLPLPLCTYALIRRKQLSPTLRSWLLVAGVSLILMLGHYSPLWEVVRRIPLVGSFRFAVRFDVPLAFAVAALASAMLDRLAAARPAVARVQLAWLRRHGLMVLFLIGLAIGVLREVGLVADETARHQKRSSETSLLVSWRDAGRSLPARSTSMQLIVVGLSAAGLAYFLVRRPRGRWLLAGLLLVDLGTLGSTVRSVRRTDVRQLTDNPLARAIERDGPHPSPPRVVNDSRSGEPSGPLWGGIPFFFDIASFNIHDPIKLETFSAALKLNTLGVIGALPRRLRDNRLLSLVGARYVVGATEMWRPLSELEGALRPSGETRVVVEISRDRPPATEVEAHVAKQGWMLGGGPASWIQSPVDVEPQRSYELAVEVAAPEGHPSGLVVALLVPGEGRPVGQKLVVAPRKLGPDVRRFTRLVQLADVPGTLRLRVASRSPAPLLIRRVTAGLLPRPRLRDGASFRPGRAKQAGMTPRGRSTSALYVPLAVDEGTELRRNRAALGRAWLVEEVIDVSSAEEALDLLRDSAAIVDPQRTALVEGIERLRGLRGGRVHRVVEWPNRVEIAVTSDGPGVLVMNAQYARGWSATVDGRPAVIHRAYGLLRAVRVPDGRATVIASYDPPGLLPGMLITLGALLLCAAILLGPQIVRARRDRPGSAANTPRSSP